MSTDQHCWWLLSNGYGGVHRAVARNAAEAKAFVRDSITETYLGEGLSVTAAHQAAASYRVWLVAGPASKAAVVDAFEHWENNDRGPAAELARRTGRPHIAQGMIGKDRC